MAVKICHLTSVHPPFDIRIFHKECCALAAQGYDTSLVATGVESQVKNGVKVLGVDKRGAGRLHRFVNTSREVIRRGLEADADIYHVHDPELLPFIFALKKRGKLVIYDAHEDLPKQTLSKEYIPMTLRKPLSFALKHVENFIVDGLDGVVAATPSIQRRFTKIYPQVINVNNFPFSSELIKGADQIEKEQAVCYVGGIAPVRGIFEMIRSVNRCEDTKMIIAGEMKAGLKDQIMAEPGWQKVEYLGVVGREGVAHAMARSRVGMVVLKPVANHVEALPIKLFEYLSAGLPIIASDFPLWKEMLKDFNCAIFVDPNNTEEIAKAITWVMENPDEAKAMGERGRQLIINKYNWENEEEKLISLYGRLSKQL